MINSSDQESVITKESTIDLGDIKIVIKTNYSTHSLLEGSDEKTERMKKLMIKKILKKKRDEIIKTIDTVINNDIL